MLLGLLFPITFSHHHHNHFFLLLRFNNFIIIIFIIIRSWSNLDYCHHHHRMITFNHYHHEFVEKSRKYTRTFHSCVLCVVVAHLWWTIVNSISLIRWSHQFDWLLCFFSLFLFFVLLFVCYGENYPLNDYLWFFFHKILFMVLFEFNFKMIMICIYTDFVSDQTLNEWW